MRSDRVEVDDGRNGFFVQKNITWKKRASHGASLTRSTTSVSHEIFLCVCT